MAELEVWLRGPLSDVPPLLQPVAHALMQADEEVTALLGGFPDRLLWARPGGVASVGFHLHHLTGVLDRLLTYAAGRALSEQQLEALEREEHGGGSVRELVGAFQAQVETTLQVLRETDKKVLLEPRGVGRAQLPSTVLGLLVHAAEHTQRHVGQLLVTVRVLQAGETTL